MEKTKLLKFEVHLKGMEVKTDLEMLDFLPDKERQALKEQIEIISQIISKSIVKSFEEFLSSKEG